MTAASNEVEVTQADREAGLAQFLHTRSISTGDRRYESICAEFRDGSRDDREAVQAFARHRILYSKPSHDVGQGLRINGIPATADDVMAIGRQLDAEDGGYPSIAHSDPHPVAEGLREAAMDALGFDPNDFVEEARGHLADMPKCIQRDYLRLALEKIEAVTAALATHSPAPMAGKVAFNVSDDEIRRIFAERVFEYATRAGSTGMRPWCDANGVNVSHASEFANALRQPCNDLLAALGLERVTRILPAKSMPFAGDMQ